MNKKVLNIFLLVVGIIVGLLLVEAVSRFFYPEHLNIAKIYRYAENERGKFARYDEMLGWIGKEDVSADFQWTDTRHHITQNREGFRGTLHPFKRGEKKRIAVLGDSFVWGFGVEDDEIFTSVLEARSGGALEVVNLGVSGYGTDQEYLLWWERGQRWDPDELYLFVTVINDLGEISTTKAYGYSKPRFELSDDGRLSITNVPVPEQQGGWVEDKDSGSLYVGSGSNPARWLVSRSAFAALLVGALSSSDSVREKLEAWQVVPRRFHGFDWEYPTFEVDPGEKSAPTWELFFNILENLNERVKKSGVTLKIVLVPSMVQVYPELWEQFIQKPTIPKGINLDPDAPVRRINAWCKDRGIETIDILGVLREAGKEDPYLYYPTNRHWTKRGHELVAETLYGAVGSTERPKR